MEAKHSFGVLGTFVDSRDGQTYKTVKIGNQTWMAENLNFEIEDSWCCDDDPENGKKYGRFYTWEAAKAACPSGWHLPSVEEFRTLIETAGGEGVAGKRLKSKFGWAGDGNGTDDFCFSAMPAGCCNLYGDFCLAGNSAYFWSASESEHAGVACDMNFGARLGVVDTDVAISVRFIKRGINSLTQRC